MGAKFSGMHITELLWDRNSHSQIHAWKEKLRIRVWSLTYRTH